jgi:hypothetical protein
MNRSVVLPIAAILALAGAFGLYLGVVSAPVSESEILEFHAARYVAETGGARTDCYGVPSGVEGVRMIVVCEREGSEAWFVAVDEAGQAVDEDVVFGEDDA